MNIFVLDKTPEKSAQFQCDKHIVKMIVETCQILYSVYYFNSKIKDIPYKLTHKNHPCMVWARESWQNFTWLQIHLDELLKEYQRRYNKEHKCMSDAIWINKYKKQIKFQKTLHTPFVQCMPEKYRSADAIEAYRNYYNGEKLGFAKWKYSQKPEWIK